MANNDRYTVRKLVLLTERQAERIADFRFEERIQSENEAIRSLIEAGLDASRKDQKQSRKG